MKLLYILLFFSLPCIAQLKGKVASIADGDTFTLLTEDKQQIKVRLYGIDCPEKKQAYGTKAKQFTSELIFGKQVQVKRTSTDKYRRTIGIVTISDGRILNEELLKSGFAWHYIQHDKNPCWQKLQKEAKLRKAGLWADNRAIAPWEFRKLKKANGVSLSR